jgi:putative transposase
MKYPVYLSAEQRSRLENMISSGRDSARVLGRARILLLSDRSQGVRREDAEVAEAVMVCAATVRRVRKQFALGGLASALYDKPRPGAIPKITGDIEARITMLACSDPPEGHARWTLRLLADKSVELGYIDSISHVAVHERLKKTRSSRGR